MPQVVPPIEMHEGATVKIALPRDAGAVLGFWAVNHSGYHAHVSGYDGASSIWLIAGDSHYFDVRGEPAAVAFASGPASEINGPSPSGILVTLYRAGEQTPGMPASPARVVRPVHDGEPDAGARGGV